MVDLHCHVLYGVDDGPDTLEESVEMLKVAKKQGIHTIVLTPHYRHGYFRYEKDQILEHYSVLREYADHLAIKLYLGTEFHVNSRCVDYFNKERCLPLAESDYVLLEYAYETEYSYIRNSVIEMINNGYECVIAHVERYKCFHKKPDSLQELRNMGVMIQVNADAVLGMEGFSLKQYCKKILKKGYVDIIASDSHGVKNRACHMEDCYKYVTKKYGGDVADRLFEENPAKICAN